MAESIESKALPRAILVHTTEGLIAGLGQRHGLLTHTIHDSGEFAADVESERATFKATADDTVRRLGFEYGEAVPSEVAHLSGVVPELVLGPPPMSATNSEIGAFVVWRTADLWLFLAGRCYRMGATARWLIMLGVAREGKEAAAVKRA
jgi:hypothetical protein